MRLVMQVSHLLMQFLAFALVVQGSAGYNVSPSPSPATFTPFPPIEEGRPSLIYHGKSPRSNGRTPESQPYVSHPPIAMPPSKYALVPQAIEGHVPSFLPSAPAVIQTYSSAPPPSIVQRSTPLLSPTTPQRKSSHENAPVPVAAAPVASPLKKSLSSPTAYPVMPGPMPPSSHQGKAPIYDAPVSEPIVPAAVPVTLPPGRLGQNPPAIHPVMPVVPPPFLPVPLASPPVIFPGNPPAIHPFLPGGPSYTLSAPAVSPISTPPLNTRWKSYPMPVAATPNKMPSPLSPYPSSEGSFPVVPPSTHKTVRHSNNAPAPDPLTIIKSSPKKGFHPPAFSPLIPFYENHHRRNKINAPVPQTIEGLVPSFLPSTPAIFPPYSSAHPPSIVQRSAPLLPPRTPQRMSSHEKPPVPVAVAPVASPLKKSPVSSPIAYPVMPGPLPPSSHQGKAPIYDAPVLEPIVPAAVPVALPPGRLGQIPPAIHPVMPAVPPPLLPVPLASPPVILPGNPPSIHPVMPEGPSYTLPAPAVSPISAPPPNIRWKRYAMPVAAPPNQMPSPLLPCPSSEGCFPVVPPSTHETVRHSTDAPTLAPDPIDIVKSSSKKGFQPPAFSPLSSFYKNHHPRNKISAPVPQDIKGIAPSFLPSTPTIFPPYSSAHPPSVVQRSAPLLPPRTPQRKSSHDKAPVPATVAPVASPLKNSPVSSPIAYPVMPGPLPPSSHQGKAPIYDAPVLEPIVPAAVPVALPPGRLGQNPPAIHPVMPAVPPPLLPVPLASPPVILPGNPPSIHPVTPGGPSYTLPDPGFSPTSAPPLNTSWKRYAMPVAAPSNETPNPLSPYPQSEGSFPVVPPSTHKTAKHSSDSTDDPAPDPINIIKSSSKKGFQPPVSSPLISFYKNHNSRNKIDGLAPSASNMGPPYASKRAPATSPGISIAPLHTPERHRASPPLKQGSSDPSSYSPYPSEGHVPPAPSPSPTDPSGRTRSVPFLSPRVSPSGSSPMKPKTPPPLPPVLALPPPPPNEDCTSLVCTDPLTNTPPGSPCDCVLPMQVGLRLGVSLYTFFPLVSELAQEIASGVFVKQSQVRIMGANAATQEPEKTIVLIDLVPLGAKFDNTTAYLTYERFWHKQVAIKASFFGDYEVLYVRYPGLPPSPPSAHSSIDVIDGEPNNGSIRKPLGVYLPRRHHKTGLSGSVIAIIVLSASVAAVLLCSALAWILIFKCTDRVFQPSPAQQPSLPSLARAAGTPGFMMGSGPSSASLSFGSSIPPYTGTTKTFSSNEIQKATDNFDPSRVVGEGGFGRVYSGVLEDGTKVAVKIIKRDDQQGGREFLAEVEMLSRLHHRNLVKLIGMCTEEHNRCLVYELIPNGSVESHLHGVDKETSPLDWPTRMKIALGAARGLAYLHEDSSPRVIHRDFKSSNILLEHDFTPKVSDFGLARTAMDEEDRHISTRVMGTFGYVAPEYAMTGHLLVKSDVYSYGVVLLELLTGKKPIDMSQPPGYENLVALARPLLTSKEGLESIFDPSLGSDISFDSVAKFAAIASMCVQSEVANRPFMGEVVQALKLVCNECDGTKEAGSKTCSQEDFSIDLDTRVNAESGQLPGISQSQYVNSNFDRDLDVERGLSMPDLFGASGRLESGSFRRHSSSGPLRTRRGRQFWQRFGRLSRDSTSEHGLH